MCEFTDRAVNLLNSVHYLTENDHRISRDSSWLETRLMMRVEFARLMMEGENRIPPDTWRRLRRTMQNAGLI